VTDFKTQVLKSPLKPKNEHTNFIKKSYLSDNINHISLEEK